MTKILNFIENLDKEILINDENKAFEINVEDDPVVFYNYFQTFGDVELGGFICKIPSPSPNGSRVIRNKYIDSLRSSAEEMFGEEFTTTWDGNYFYILPVERKKHGHPFPKCCGVCKQKYMFGTSWDIRCDYTGKPVTNTSSKLCMLFK